MSEYTTYYVSVNGEPRNNVQRHDHLGDAIAAWVANCGALIERNGGMAVILDNAEYSDGREADRLLAWHEHAEGAYVEYDGEALPLDGDYESPQAVAAAMECNMDAAMELARKNGREDALESHRSAVDAYGDTEQDEDASPRKRLAPSEKNFDEGLISAVGPAEAIDFLGAKYATIEQWRQILAEYERAAREAWDAACAEQSNQ